MEDQIIDVVRCKSIKLTLTEKEKRQGMRLPGIAAWKSSIVIIRDGKEYIPCRICGTEHFRTWVI